MAEKRLIDANSLKKKAKPDIDSGEYFVGVQEIDEEPTVDAVEVVICRDCKWYMPGDLFTDTMFCHRLKKENGKPAKYARCDDDFCSYGERKEGAENG